MKNTYILSITDPDEPSYGGTYVLQHTTRTEHDLRLDYAVVLRLLSEREDWCVGEIMRTLEELGWKIVDIPTVNVTY